MVSAEECLISPSDSLRDLCVLCVSAVKPDSYASERITAEHAEAAQGLRVGSYEAKDNCICGSLDNLVTGGLSHESWLNRQTLSGRVNQSHPRCSLRNDEGVSHSERRHVQAPFGKAHAGSGRPRL